MPLTPLEREFVMANYSNYTAKELSLSLNKLRKAAKLPLLSYKEVSNYVGNQAANLNANASSISLLPKLPLIRGKPPSVSPDDKKTMALREYLNETQQDELCISLQELMEWETEEDGDLGTSLDDRIEEDDKKEN